MTAKRRKTTTLFESFIFSFMYDKGFRKAKITKQKLFYPLTKQQESENIFFPQAEQLQSHTTTETRQSRQCSCNRALLLRVLEKPVPKLMIMAAIMATGFHSGSI